jgi:hypothetical protein
MLNIINAKDSIQMLDWFLKKIKFAQKKESIDVRAKFIYEKGDNSKIEICIDSFNVVVNGSLIKPDRKFLGFLKSLVPKEQFPRK